MTFVIKQMKFMQSVKNSNVFKIPRQFVNPQSNSLSIFRIKNLNRQSILSRSNSFSILKTNNLRPIRTTIQRRAFSQSNNKYDYITKPIISLIVKLESYPKLKEWMVTDKYYFLTIICATIVLILFLFRVGEIALVIYLANNYPMLLVALYLLKM